MEASDQLKYLRKWNLNFSKKVKSFMWSEDMGEFKLVTTSDGNLYWFGKMRFGEKVRVATKRTRLEVPNSVVRMAHGEDHILLLDKRGQLYSMGYNRDNNLGLNREDGKIYFSPHLIPSPHKFVSIRCGECHNLALTEDGKVWAWGQNLCGRLGVSRNLDKFAVPLTQISELDGYRVIDIACGFEHSLALTDTGDVYSWGSNEWGQLGRDDLGEKLFLPTRVPFHLPVHCIAAGNGHTLLLTQDTESVYICGKNYSGQFENSSPKSASCDLCKVFNLPRIIDIAAHYTSNLWVALSYNWDCFVWRDTNVPEKISTNIYWTAKTAFSLITHWPSSPYAVLNNAKPVDLIEHKEKVAYPVVVDDIPVDLIKHKKKLK